MSSCSGARAPAGPPADGALTGSAPLGGSARPDPLPTGFYTSAATCAPYVNTGPVGSDVTRASPDPPAYNASNPKAATFIPSPWGCKMCRLTGYPGSPILVDGTTDTGLTFERTHGHDAYSTCGMNTFNADGTLILIGAPPSHGGRPLLLTAADFLIRRVAGYRAKDLTGPRFGYGFWHATEPNHYLDATDRGDAILIRRWTIDAANGAHDATTLRTISGYTSVSLQGQGRYGSRDGHRLAIEAQRVSDGVKVWFGYDISTGQKTQDFVTAPDGGPYELAFISASGDYMVPGLGPWKDTPGGRVFDVYAFGSPGPFVGERRSAPLSHSTFWYDGSEDWRIGQAKTSRAPWHSGDMLAVRLSDGAIRRLTSISRYDYCGQGFDTRYVYAASVGGPLSKEIVAVRADQSHLNVWRRLGPHRAFVKNIRDQPDPVASRNGDMVIFDTNWQAVTGSDPISTRRFPVIIYDLLAKEWAAAAN